MNTIFTHSLLFSCGIVIGVGIYRYFYLSSNKPDPIPSLWDGQYVTTISYRSE